MRKPSKLVPREELETARAESHRYSIALNAVLNHQASKAYRVTEPGAPGNWYMIRFIERQYTSALAISTFHCSTTGQRDMSTVYEVDDELTECSRYSGDWARVFMEAYSAWRRDVYQATRAEVAA